MSGKSRPSNHDLTKAIIGAIVDENCEKMDLNKIWTKLKFPKVRDFWDCVKYHDDILRIEENGGKKKKVVYLDIQVKLCPDYCSESDCSNLDCGMLHVCKFFILSNSCTSKDNSCKYGHNIHSTHNRRVCRKFLLEDMKIASLRKLVRLRRNRTEASIPRICSFYNVGNGCSKRENCTSLHICQYYFWGKCKFRASCKRSHTILTNCKILERFGFNTTQRQDAILEEIKDLYNLVGLQGKKIDGDISGKRANHEDLQWDPLTTVRERPSTSRKRPSSSRDELSSPSKRSSLSEKLPSRDSRKAVRLGNESERPNSRFSPNCIPNSVKYKSPIPDYRYTSPNDRSTSPSDRSSSPSDRSTSPNDRHTSPSDRSTSPNDRSTSPNDRSTSPNDRSTSPNDRSTSPNDRSSSPSDRSSSPCNIPGPPGLPPQNSTFKSRPTHKKQHTRSTRSTDTKLRSGRIMGAKPKTTTSINNEPRKQGISGSIQPSSSQQGSFINHDRYFNSPLDNYIPLKSSPQHSSDEDESDCSDN